jgi:hypothetical protein
MIVVSAFGMVINVTFSHLKVPPRSSKKLKKKHNTLNDVVLTNSYKLGFSFDLGYVKVQFNLLSLDFVLFYP